MSEEIEEIYEGWAEGIENRPRKKGKRVDPNTKTGKAIRAARQRAGLENRQGVARRSLAKFAERFVMLEKNDSEGNYRVSYAAWIARSRTQGFPELDRRDILVKQSTPAVGAGGQHRDHKRTARQLFHTLTGIEVVSDERVGGERNFEMAFERMYDQLDKHVHIWDALLAKKLPKEEIEMRVLAELNRLVPNGQSA